MGDALQERGKVVWVQIGFEVEFDSIRMSDRGSSLDDVHDDLFVLFRLDAGDVDEGQDDVVRTDLVRDVEQAMKKLLSLSAFAGVTAQQGVVHEPVGADSRRSDAMLPLQFVQFREAVGG